jgi:hypothetical protein
MGDIIIIVSIDNAAVLAVGYCLKQSMNSFRAVAAGEEKGQ